MSPENEYLHLVSTILQQETIMRADMKDVIINTGRYGKYGESRKTQPTRDLEKMDELPEREGLMKRWREGRWGWQHGDRINPLRKWIRKQVGRPLDDVYSDLCEHADDRNVRGKHLREHFWIEVQTYEQYEAAKHQRYGWPKAFYADENGILRATKYKPRHRYTPKVDPDKCMIGDRRFERINDCWFEVWYEKEEKARKQWNYLLRRTEVEYYYVDVKVRQRQLSKRDLRDLGFTNGRSAANNR
jgi:hypothetical protein